MTALSTRRIELSLTVLLMVALVAVWLPQPVRGALSLPLALALPAIALAWLSVRLGAPSEVAVGIGLGATVALWALVELALLWVGLPVSRALSSVVLAALVVCPLLAARALRDAGDATT